MSGGALALANFGPGVGLLGGSVRPPAEDPLAEDPPNENPPAEVPDAREDTTPSEDTQGAQGRTSSPTGEDPTELEAEVRAAAEDYYGAAGAGD